MSPTRHLSVCPDDSRIETPHSSAKVMTCSRCRNHGLYSILKGHKTVCPWRFCNCSSCALILRRSEINRRFLGINKGVTAGIRECLEFPETSYGGGFPADGDAAGLLQNEVSSQPAGSWPCMSSSSFLQTVNIITSPKGLIQKQTCLTTWTCEYKQGSFSSVHGQPSPQPVLTSDSAELPRQKADTAKPSSEGISYSHDTADARPVVMSQFRQIFPGLESRTISRIYDLCHGNALKTFSALSSLPQAGR